MRAALQESAMLIVVARRGKTECTEACPFYEASGRIACFGGPKASHCRMIMKPYFVDCNHYDITTLRVLEMPEDSSETATIPTRTIMANIPRFFDSHAK